MQKISVTLARDWNPVNHSITIATNRLVMSPKLDGIRCLVTRDGGQSRAGKVFPNSGIRAWLEELGRQLPPEIVALDGELVCGKHDNSTWSRTSSAVMNKGAKVHEDLRFHIFDCITVDAEMPWHERFKATMGIPYLLSRRCRFVPHISIMDPDHLTYQWGRWVEMGYEGLMVRDSDAPYIHGRTGCLRKCKIWDFDESRAVGVEQMCRSDGNGGKVKMAGVIVLENGVRLGTGFDDEMRTWWWENRHLLADQNFIIRYKFFPPVGGGCPRHPVYVSKGLGEQVAA